MELSWLEQLEEKVRQASERLRALKDANRSLEKRIGELEQKLQAAESESAAWPEEREEIRGRVQGLADKLEELLTD